jgi:hypothetical protein
MAKPPRDPIPHDDVPRAAKVVAAELVATVDMLHRAEVMSPEERAADPRLHQALTEAGLTHLRGLIELILDRNRDSDLHRDDFAPGWEPTGANGEVERLTKGLDVLDTKLAHVTLVRVEQPVVWAFWAMAALDLLTVFYDFVRTAHIYHLDAANPLDEGVRQAGRCVRWPAPFDDGDDDQAAG